MAGRNPSMSAWAMHPSDYLSTRPILHKISSPRSVYVPMADGCRLALDVYLPVLDGGALPLPTIVIFTPYYRRFKVKAGSEVEACPNVYAYRDFFVPRGYAVVTVDVRGTGASFGTRDSFRSPNERCDSSEIVDWIVAQPWCNGIVGSTGISYLGAAADFLASTGHPAVKAIAPLFSVWDTYADNYFPGGLQLKSLTQTYDEIMIGLDHDRRDVLQPFDYFNSPDFEGPQPVDDDPDGELLREAIRQHLGNFRQTDFMPEFRFREEGLPYDPSFSSASFSPYAASGTVRSDVAILSVSGWYDGAGYMNGAISRHLTLDGNPRHLLLGPWDHGARIDGSPWRATPQATFPVLGEVLRFFDTYLMKRDTGLKDEDPIHYFCVHAEAWRSAKSWPPVDGSHVLHLGSGNTLAPEAAGEGAVDHAVDFTIGTGRHTRYERIAGIATSSYYDDWQGRSERMLSFDSAPLPEAIELSGHPILDLWLASSEPDAAFFVYLGEIEEDGCERYVTEGLLRGLHRQEAPAPTNYRTSWPFRSFSRADAAPLPVGETVHIRIPLLPIAWRFSRNSRIRLSLAGADADHCAQVPHGRPPRLTIRFGGQNASMLTLPTAAKGR